MPSLTYWADNSGHLFELGANGYVLAEGKYYQDTVVPLCNVGSITAKNECKNYLDRSCVVNVLGQLNPRDGAASLSKAKGNSVISKFAPRAAKKLIKTAKNFGVGVLNYHYR